MTREELTRIICPTFMTSDCEEQVDCNYCKEKMNKWLDEYDRQIRAEVIEEFNRKIDYLKNCYVDACNMCTRMECDVSVNGNLIYDLEQLKENK